MSGPEIPPGLSYTLVFYSRSADAEPGRGAGERVAETVPPDVRDAMTRLRGIHARRMLSNFSSCCPFQHDGRWYATVEHAYQAAKLLACMRYMVDRFQSVVLAGEPALSEATTAFGAERLASAKTKVDTKAVQDKIEKGYSPLQEIDDIEAYAAEFEHGGQIDTPAKAKAAGGAKGCRDRGIVLVGVLDRVWTPDVAAHTMEEIQEARFRECDTTGVGCGMFARVVRDTEGAALFHYARSNEGPPKYVRFEGLERLRSLPKRQ